MLSSFQDHHEGPHPSAKPLILLYAEDCPEASTQPPGKLSAFDRLGSQSDFFTILTAFLRMSGSLLFDEG